MPDPELPIWRRREAALAALVSALVVLPCWWQPLVQAGDFSSHVYNAWLAKEIEADRLPGLWLTSQRTNVLFDLLLGELTGLLGWRLGENAAASVLVLVFVWGAFALASAMSGRRAWPVLPSIAMLAYGWVFHVGFANFYLALGLCLWALALAWRGDIRQLALAVALLALAATAHLLPVTWAVSAAVYATAARALEARGRIVLGAAAIISIFVARLLLMTRFPTLWALEQAFGLTGTDQVWVYSAKYFVVSFFLLLFWTLLLLRRVEAEGGRPVLLGIPFQVYMLTAAVVVLIPTRVDLPQYEHALVYISHRMSLAAAVALVVCLAGARPSKWQLAGLTTLAALFFSFQFVDARALNELENRMTEAVRKLPPRQRVISALCDDSSRIDPLVHMVDRVCAGRCFSYANYEASTTQFRVRAQAGNGVVVTDYGDSWSMQRGDYEVRSSDLPLFEISFCAENSQELCVRELEAGRKTGRTCGQVTPAWW